MVRNAGITTILFTRISTELGKIKCHRCAKHGLLFVVASDTVSPSDKDPYVRSLQNIKRLLTVASTNELANIWSI